MIKIDLNSNLKDLKGNDLSGTSLTLGGWLAKLLAELPDKSDPIKYLDFARTLDTTSCLEVDKSDYDKIFNIVKSSESVAVLVKGQILERMQSDKEKSNN